MVESPQTFGKYTLLGKVAAGGMAEIYRAKTTGPAGSDKVLAIKRLHPRFNRDDKVARMLADEARIAVQLSHPNITQIFDLGCIDDQYFIAMEYVDGIDLSDLDLLDQRRHMSAPAAIISFVMAEVLGGLHYAHTRTDAGGRPLEIVHRDVSPQNIMISRAGQVKLVDFGIAKAQMQSREVTRKGIIKGKFYYMAPEQAYGHHVDGRTDVFSAGMVMYELLVGENPYAGIEEFELLKAVRQADFAPLDDVCDGIDPDIAAIVGHATRRNAKQRYPSAHAMQRALAGYLDGLDDRDYRRELAHCVGRSADPASGPDAQYEPMLRDDYAPSNASIIFEVGASLAGALSTPADDDGGGQDNPFLADEPTQVWGPDDRRADESAAGTRGGFSHDMPAPDPSRPPAWSRFGSDALGRLSNLSRAQRGAVALVCLTVVSAAVVAMGAFIGAPEPDPNPATDVEPRSSPDLAPATDTVGRQVTTDVRVTTDPPGAKVLVDGRDRGTTPVVLVGLSVDKTYQLDVSRGGFEPVERQLDAGHNSASVDIKLTADGGVLDVATYPSNAVIWVDDTRRGRSPIDVSGLSRSAQHRLVAELDDGRRVHRDIRWADDGRRVQRIELRFDR